jgi:hypothetical protein
MTQDRARETRLSVRCAHKQNLNLNQSQFNNIMQRSHEEKEANNQKALLFMLKASKNLFGHRLLHYTMFLINNASLRATEVAVINHIVEGIIQL